MSNFDEFDVCRNILESLLTGVCVVDTQKKIVLWSDGAERITGHLRHEVIGRSFYGFPIRAEKRKYDYLASASQSTPGSVSIDEYRSDKLTPAGYPDQIASAGFATLALILHPDMRGDFELQCEGLGDWRGQASWLVHFRQRSDRPNRMHSYGIGKEIFPVALKGRAWITQITFKS